MTAPNIIFILIDDMGWRDLGCYGSTFYETPHLDALAADGMRFTDAYAACPVCSPTRASLLTGKYPATLGITDWIDARKHIHPARGKLIDVPYIDHLPLNETTIATRLREAGYATWHVGKWHLGGPDYYPDRHGFDVNVGGWEAGSPSNGYFSPWGFPTLSDGPDGEYLTDRLTDEAIALIRGSVQEEVQENAQNNTKRPFFLNLWYYSVHTPIQAKAEKIAKYEAKAHEMGLDKLETFAEGDFFPCEHKRDQRITRRLVQSDPVYAAMIESLDENIGRLLATLDATGQRDNTIIIFTSDNGGLATAEGSPTCNAPLAEGKGWMYEGGTREPFLVRWPGVVQPGSTCSTPITSPDLFPTLCEVAAANTAADTEVEGESIIGLLRGENGLEREAVYWHYPHYGNQGGTPGSSVRVGAYKLIEFFEDGRLELYNLREDISEERDLAAVQPQTVAHLHGLLRAWRGQVEAKIPQPNPEYEKQ